ncbi:MAG TPA: hypothetical protein VMD04_02010 [Candidatus Margulisiibacteriota bacterium]|nr:hypothetical protein [Candidatus Margulisiibacteriota bacterium]
MAVLSIASINLAIKPAAFLRRLREKRSRDADLFIKQCSSGNISVHCKSVKYSPPRDKVGLQNKFYRILKKRYARSSHNRLLKILDGLSPTLNDIIKRKNGLSWRDIADKKCILDLHSYMLVRYDQKNKKIYSYVRRFPDKALWKDRINNEVGQLRTWVSLILLSNNKGIMVHGVAIEKNSGAYLFMGPSHSGKTTAARLCAANSIISDDITPIFKEGTNIFYTCAVPWSKNSLGKNPKMTQIKLPVRAIFFVQKSRKTSCKPVSGNEALRRILKDASSGPLIMGRLLMAETRFMMNAVLFLRSLFSSLPVFELKVQKTPAFKNQFEKIIRKIA